MTLRLLVLALAVAGLSICGFKLGETTHPVVRIVPKPDLSNVLPADHPLNIALQEPQTAGLDAKERARLEDMARMLETERAMAQAQADMKRAEIARILNELTASRKQLLRLEMELERIKAARGTNSKNNAALDEQVAVEVRKSMQAARLLKSEAGRAKRERAKTKADSLDRQVTELQLQKEEVSRVSETIRRLIERTTTKQIADESKLEQEVAKRLADKAGSGKGTIFKAEAEKVRAEEARAYNNMLKTQRSQDIELEIAKRENMIEDQMKASKDKAAADYRSVLAQEDRRLSESYRIKTLAALKNSSRDRVADVATVRRYLDANRGFALMIALDNREELSLSPKQVTALQMLQADFIKKFAPIRETYETLAQRTAGQRTEQDENPGHPANSGNWNDAQAKDLNMALDNLKKEYSERTYKVLNETQQRKLKEIVDRSLSGAR